MPRKESNDEAEIESLSQYSQPVYWVDSQPDAMDAGTSVTSTNNMSESNNGDFKSGDENRNDNDDRSPATSTNSASSTVSNCVNHDTNGNQSATRSATRSTTNSSINHVNYNADDDGKNDIEVIDVSDEQNIITVDEDNILATGTIKTPTPSKASEKRQALRNRTLKCTACTAGNDGEFIHAFLSIPICGSCNKSVLDTGYPRAESGQELRCTYCGDGT